MKYPATIFCFLTAAFLTSSISSPAQQSGIFQPSIPELLKNKELSIINRNASMRFIADYVALHLDAKQFPGAAWLKDTSFSTGTIEFDVKGLIRRKGVLSDLHFTGRAGHMRQFISGPLTLGLPQI